MQWLLQDFEDTRHLARTLDRLGVVYSWHKIVPFVGELRPEPQIQDPRNVILFGAYSLWRYAARHNLSPGVIRIAPFLHQSAWLPHLLNGASAKILPLRDLPEALAQDARSWFIRPVEDSKEIAGKVLPSQDIVDLARNVLALPPEDLPRGSLRHDTAMMLSRPMRIQKEWRIWLVADEVVTYALYKEGARVTYRPEIDADALDFARQLVAENPGYARAYVLDICRCDDGLRMLETNCLNAAGFYAADLDRLVGALSAMPR